MKKLVKQSIKLLEPIKATLDTFGGDTNIDELRNDVDFLLNLFRDYQKDNGDINTEVNNGLKLLALVIKLFIDDFY